MIVSTVQIGTPSASAPFPVVDEYIGLQALQEVGVAGGGVEVRCFWASEWAADREEARLCRALGATSVVRESIDYVKLRSERWWKRILRLGYVAGIFASIVAVMNNLDDIKTFFEKVWHNPEMVVEGPEILNLSSVHKETRTITLRGDPFFRTRISSLSMRIVPDPAYPETQPLPKGERKAIPTSHRSVDVSDTLGLAVTFDPMPPGHYQFVLEGRIETGWNAEDFGPTPPIPVEVRAPLVLERKKVEAWPPGPHTPDLYPSALVDFHIVFGKSQSVTQDLRFVIDGEWTRYEVTGLPSSVQILSESKNSTTDAKAAVFVLRGVPADSFSSQFFRVELRSRVDLTKEKWPGEVSKFIVEAAQ